MHNWKTTPHTNLNQAIFWNILYFLCMNMCLLLTSNSSDGLVWHASDVFNGKRLEVVLLEKIISAEAKQLKGDTNMAMVVKPVQHLHTPTRGGKIQQMLSTFPICQILNTIFLKLSNLSGMKLLWMTYYLLSGSSDFNVWSTSTSDIAASW